MKGDFSRDIFDSNRHYAAVLLEQGGLITDSDWNEQQAIECHRREQADADIIGSCAAPIDAAAFALSPSVRPRALTSDASSPPRLWVAAEDGYLLHSSDQGTTWQIVDTGSTRHLNAIRFGSSAGWVVGESGIVFTSSDLGTTWERVDVGTNVRLRSVATSGVTRVWIVGDSGLVAVSVDGGTNWERKVLAATQLNDVAIQGTLNGIVVGSAGAIFVTADGGETWQSRTSGTTADLHAVVFVDASNAWAVGDRGVIVRSTDGGTTWTAQSSTSPQRLRALSFTSALEGVVVGDAGTLLTTTDAGSTWTSLPSGVTVALRSVVRTATDATAVTADGTMVHAPLAGGAPAAVALPLIGLTLSAGRYYVDGTLCEVAEPVAYFNQPDRGPTARLAPGQHLVYVHVWRRHLSALEADGIREVALGDADPSSRARVVWQVRTLELPLISPPQWTCTSSIPAWDELVAAPTARLSARAEPQQQPANLCDVGAAAGFRRLENQLYRVEIHEGGAQPLFKWSRENGSIAFGIECISAPSTTSPVTTVVRLRSRGRDQTLDLAPGDRVEIVNDDLVLEQRVGPLFEVVGDGDDALEIVLAGAVPADLVADPSRHPLLRRWDQRPTGTDALEIVPETWIELEDGVQVRFAADAEYRAGDHWSIPARTVTGDVEWPRDASGVPLARPPAGIEDRYCRLGIIEVAMDGTITALTDCRYIFPPLTALTNLFYVGGDGQEVAPNPLDPINLPLPAPLRVAVFNGSFPVAGAQVQFDARQGALPNGSRTQVVMTGADGVASIQWSLDAFVRNQAASAQLLESGAPAAGKFNVIQFAARLSVAERVAYDPRNCPDLQALRVNNVQAAIDALCRQTHGGGCCVTVGERGEFTTLDQALRALLARDEFDICICLLPGVHGLEDSIDVQRPGLKLAIHGSGRASRLILRAGQEFSFIDLDALQLAELDILAGDEQPTMLRFVRCAELSLTGLRVIGLTEAGRSLVQIDGATRIDIVGSHITGHLGEGLRRARILLDRVPSLEALARAFRPAADGLFAPIGRDVAETFTRMSTAQRRRLVTELRRFVERNDPELDLSTEEIEAANALQARLASQDAFDLRGALEGLRAAFLLKMAGFALSIGDGNARTLLADNEIYGRISVYGEASGPHGVDEELDPLSVAILTGRVVLARGAGDLRLRNNRLRQLRLGDDFVRRLKLLASEGGTMTGCFSSVIVNDNTLAGPDSQLLGVDLAFSSNLMRPFEDVGMTIATQMKCVGNFAHNDFRLFNLGNRAEKNYNGGLNVIDVQ
jgi:photosystem II stability/assembly factor-like uncharacterized protein